MAGPARFSPILALFLFGWPFVLPLAWWRILPGSLHLGFLIVGVLLYLRVAVASVSAKLAPTTSRERRDFQGQVDHEDLERLQMYCQFDGDDLTPLQMRYFAASVLAPQVIRRRVTDEYVPAKRTLRKTVTVELDVDDRFVLPLSAAVRNLDNPSGDGWGSAAEAFVALTLPWKGQMYDQFAVSDAAGATLPHLSQREYRLLAAKTLRILLRAAFGGRSSPLPNAALEAEELALQEIVRFMPVRRSGSPAEDAGRSDAVSAHRSRALNKLWELEDHGGQREFLTLAVQLVAQLSERYAVVAVIPAGRPRLVVRYAQTLIPGLQRPARWCSVRGVRDRLRIFFGARPVFLTVDARNAVTCHTYHLIITTPPDLYLGEFDISPIVSLDDVAPGGRARIEPYWRVGGRRGQNYFHLYTRGLRTSDPRTLSVSAKFFEVPPGSLAPAAAAALANFLVVFAVGVLVSMQPGGGMATQIDTQISAFLLAVPGLAAAWLGFEFRPSELLEGTLVARLSSAATFGISLLASIALLFRVSRHWSTQQAAVYVFARADLTWTVLATAATMHLIAIASIYWLRTQYYRRLVVKPVADSAIMMAD